MRFLLFSNLYIAVAATLFTRETYALLGVPARWSPLLALVFLATLVVYNLDRLSGASEEDTVDATRRHRFVRRRRGLLWGVTGLAGVGCGAVLLFLPMPVVWALIPLGLASLAYSLPLLWGRSGPYRLKDVAGLKIFVIAFVWAGATAFLPAVQVLEDPFTARVGWVVAGRAVFIFAITLPFDIRDMPRDRASAIRTIPLMIGVKKSRWLAVALIGVFAAMVLVDFGVAVGGPGPPLLVSAAVTAAVLTRAGSERGELYHVGLLDGMMILQWALVAGWTAL